MTRGSLLRRTVVVVAALAVAGQARAQTLTQSQICPTGVTLKAFNPVDSLFPNPTATTFTIKLVNAVTGCPSEYRVSHFADFHDASWTAYTATPSTIVQRSWFPTTTNGTSQITLYFQVRVKNPRGGIPTSIGGPPAPDFFTSAIFSHAIRVMYFG